MEKNENGYSRSGLPENTAPSCPVRETDDVQLAMVYSPYQYFCHLYTPEDALSHGTLFEQLYKPLETEEHGR